MTQRRPIEEAFLLKKVSEDSKHDKNVRHGHISTLLPDRPDGPLSALGPAVGAG